MNNGFPTRQYPYRRAEGGLAQFAPASNAQKLEAGVLYRFILGLDDQPEAVIPAGPRLLAQAESDALGDRFGRLLRTIVPHPLHAHSLVAALDATGMTRSSFVVGEGLQIPWDAKNAHLTRQTRMVVAWMNGSELAVLLSTAPPFDSEQIFLQVIGWDHEARHFNFYERRLGAWIYAGNSDHALSEPTRGRGPFDSHVNGALVMKELKAPWLHWSSMAAFELPGIAPGDPVRNETLFKQRSGAEELEQLVRTGVTLWTSARFDAVLANPTLEAPALVQHLLKSTTVNLVSSAAESTTAPLDDRLPLPVTPFLDSALLLDVLEIESNAGALSAPWPSYQRLLIDHGYELRDEAGKLAQKGDTHFALPAFERSLEDVKVVAALIQRGVLSPRLVACLAMVDFPNPVWSVRRASLMCHVPPTTARNGQTWDLDDRIVAAISAADAPPDSPEAEFLQWWNMGGNWRIDFGRHIDSYLTALQMQLDTWSGFEAIGRLLESQRRRARKRPLLEFSLTLPRATALPDTSLRMTTTATIEEIQNAHD